MERANVSTAQSWAGDEAAAQVRTNACNLHRQVTSEDKTKWGIGAFLASEGLGPACAGRDAQSWLDLGLS